MFKKLEVAWNARTPVWLHNGTKENLIFQISTAFILCAAMYAWDEYKNRRDFPSMYEKTPIEN